MLKVYISDVRTYNRSPNLCPLLMTKNLFGTLFSSVGTPVVNCLVQKTEESQLKNYGQIVELPVFISVHETLSNFGGIVGRIPGTLICCGTKSRQVHPTH